MPNRFVRGKLRDARLHRLSWTFLDQGVVSAGGFVVQIALARQLAAADYGVFALIFSGLLMLQLCNATLLFHPMSVRVGASLLLVVALSAVLSIVLAIVLAVFGKAALIMPVLLFFMAWQVQEGLRRSLLGSLWHAAAIVGDAITYGGQALAVVGLSLYGSLSIGNALYAMAASAAVGAIVHTGKLQLAQPTKSRFRWILIDFWSIGGLASLSNGLLSVGRMLAVPWALAALSGPAAAAGFQAASNIINLSNPLSLGLGNIIPQAAASARSQGDVHAWRTVRGYALIASPPIVLYFVAVFIAPTGTLRLFYGATSDYMQLTLAVRLLVLVGLTGFAIEAVLAFLHGITLVRRAAAINMAGTAISAILAFPLVSLFGLAGGCMALLLANLVRTALTWIALARLAATAVKQPA
jgi:O-antigen/teichoic acid export membrane protein